MKKNLSGVKYGIVMLAAVFMLLPLVGCAQKVKEYKFQVVESLPHERRIRWKRWSRA